MRVLLLFLLIGFAFAAWQQTAAVAVLASFSIISLLLMISIAFDLRELSIYVKNEFYEVIVVIIIIISISTATTFFDELGKSITGTGNFTTSAINILQSNYEIEKQTINSLKDASLVVSLASSRTAFCTFAGASLGMANCNAYRVLSTSVTAASPLLSAALIQTTSLYSLLLFSNYAMAVLLPLGLFLRSFSITRGAGGVLIALAVSLYFVLPLSIYIFNYVIKYYEENSTFSSSLSIYYHYVDSLKSVKCNPWEKNTKAEKDVLNLVNSPFKSPILEPIIFFAFVKVTLPTVFSFAFMVFGIRFFSSLLGSQVDITAFARLM